MHDGWTIPHAWSGVKVQLHAFTVERRISSDPPKVLPHRRGSGGQIHRLQALPFGRQAFDETDGRDDEQHSQEAEQKVGHEARHGLLHDDGRVRCKL